MSIRQKGQILFLFGLLTAGLEAAAQTGAVTPAGEGRGGAPAAEAERQDTWTVNIRNADIQAFITQVAEMTGKNFVVDPRVRSRDVTVISTQPLTSSEVYELFLSVLQVHGYAAVPAGNAVKIVNNTVAKQASQPVIEDVEEVEADAIVTKVLPVENASVGELMPSLRPLVPQYGHLSAVMTANALIISDHAENIARIEQIVAQLDGVEADDVELIQLKHAWVGDVLELVQTLSGPQEGANQRDRASKHLTVVADKRTNRLIVKGDGAVIERIRALVHELDIPHDDGGTVQVVRLAHADAKALAELLQNFVDGTKGQSSAKDNAAGGPRNGEVSIQADESMNALVIRAEPEKMNELKSVISQLDVRRAQILIEAAIVEITGDKGRALGFQYLAGDTDHGVGGVNFSNAGVSINQILGAVLADTPTGVSLNDGITLGAGEFNDDGDLQWGAILQALASTTAANLLSTPSILTLDNQEASIIVGENVPFVTGQSTNTGSGVANPFTTIQREDVGLTLKVIPHLAGEETIRLELEQETSSVKDAAASPSGQQPVDIVTTKRQIKTVVLADDGETIVLGGLIRDDIQNVVRKVPLLGDIPILGTLFRTSSKTRSKQNLMVFLRPTILADNDRLTGLTRERYLGITARQYEVNRNGDLERVVKYPLPSDPQELFRGRDPLPPRLREYYEERVESQPAESPPYAAPAQPSPENQQE